MSWFSSRSNIHDRIPCAMMLRPVRSILANTVSSALLTIRAPINVHQFPLDRRSLKNTHPVVEPLTRGGSASHFRSSWVGIVAGRSIEKLVVKGNTRNVGQFRENRRGFRQYRLAVLRPHREMADSADRSRRRFRYQVEPVFMLLLLFAS